MSSSSRLSGAARLRANALPAWPPPAVNVLVALTMGWWAAQGVLAVWEAAWTAGGPLRPASEALLALLWGTDTPGMIERAGALSWDALRAGRWWTPLTHLFLHGGLIHAGGNALVLWFAGRPVEAILGRRALLALWLAGGALGALTALAVAPEATLLGGSAAAGAVLFAMVTMLPELDLRTLLPFLRRLPVAVRARHFGWGCLVAFLVVPLLGADADAATSRGEALAHAAGAVAGWTGARLLGFGRQRRAAVVMPLAPRFRRAAPVPAGPVKLEVLAEGSAALAPAEFVRQVANPILEKLRRGGWGALTPRECALLDEASRRLREGG